MEVPLYYVLVQIFFFLEGRKTLLWIVQLFDIFCVLVDIVFRYLARSKPQTGIKAIAIMVLMMEIEM